MNDPLYESEYLFNETPADPLNILNRINANKKKKKYRKCPKLYQIIIYVMIISTLILQCACLFYLVSITNAVKELNLTRVNVTEAQIYIKKLETIIDYACGQFVTC